MRRAGISPWLGGRARRGVALPASAKIVPEGDSITYGLGATGNTAGSYPALALPGLAAGPAYTIANIATSGKTAQSMRDDYATRLGAQYDATKAMNLASIMAGTNDNAIQNRIPAYRALRQLIAFARRTGYDRVALATLISRNDQPFNGDSFADRNFDGATLQLNIDILAYGLNDMDADRLMNFGGAGGVFPTRASLSGYLAADGTGTHPNDAGYALMAPVARDAYNAAIAGARSRAASPAKFVDYDVSAYLGIANGGRTISVGGGSFGGLGWAGMPERRSGKFYFEYLMDNVANAAPGLGTRTFKLTQVPNDSNAYADNNSYSLAIYNNDGSVRYLNSIVCYIDPFANGDVVAMAVDADANKLWVRVNAGAWKGNGAGADPVAGVSGISLAAMRTADLAYIGAPQSGFCPAGFLYASPAQLTARFAAAQMTGTIPSGFAALAA